MIRAFMLLPAIVCPLLGCTLQRSDHYTAVFVNMPPDMQAEAIAALDEWSSKTGGAFSYQVDQTCNQHCMFFYVGTNAWLAAKYGGDAIGETDHREIDDMNYITIAQDPPDWERRITVRHEIGHALGLEHYSSCNSIMHPGVKCSTPHVSCMDVETFAQIHGVVADCVE